MNLLRNKKMGLRTLKKDLREGEITERTITEESIENRERIEEKGEKTEGEETTTTMEVRRGPTDPNTLRRSKTMPSSSNEEKVRDLLNRRSETSKRSKSKDSKKKASLSWANPSPRPKRITVAKASAPTTTGPRTRNKGDERNEVHGKLINIISQ
jgi:hypothetical protein